MAKSIAEMNVDPTPKPSKKFTMPHIYVILFIFIAIGTIATYFVPAGVYERVAGPEGRTTIDPDSYTVVEQTPVGIVGFMKAIPAGLVGAGEVVFFTFIIGGLFMVLRKTGIIEIGVDKITRTFAQKSIVVIPVLMVLFSVVCSLIGTQELSLVYVPVILPLMIALGYDSISAAAVALIATTAGFSAGFLNPINTGLGQKLSSLPLYSGVELRIVVYLVLVAVGIAYVIRYARKVKASPEASLVYQEDEIKRKSYSNGTTEKLTISSKQKMASWALLVFFGILIYGVLAQGWFMMEMAGLFIVMGIVIGLIAGLKPTQICEGFNDGFREVLVGAIIVGVARAVAVVLEQGQIMDTIIYNLGAVVAGFPAIFSAIGMFFVQLLFNFLVPSGSGQALVTMPIMAPLSDLIGVTRQTAVLAYQLGDGLGNILFPTSGYFMATLALAGVSWHKWVKFFLPLFLLWVAIAVVFLIITQAIQWAG